MNEIAWIAVGATSAITTIWLWHLVTVGKKASGQTEPLDEARQTPTEKTRFQTAQQTQKATSSPSSQDMAVSLATELANLVSAVEGRAHHLIEAAPSRAQLPGAAEAMLTSISRLRTLHTKLIAFGRERPVGTGTTDVIELIASLGDELQQMQLGLELRWDPPDSLPRIDACPAAMRDALIFVCSALLHAERGATRLTVSVERSFASTHPALIIELNLEWVNAADTTTTDKCSQQASVLDLEAAKHLVQSYGGELTLSHLPGKSVQAVAHLPMAVPQEDRDNPDEVDAAAVSSDFDIGSSHQFGGALVLESDTTLRAVLARELKATGRAVFACADGASAHTFLQATPDRFELLIVDDARQLNEHTPLARTIRQHAPMLKICLLTPSPHTSPTEWPEVHCLQKPFGIHELRRTLASILSEG